MGAVGWSPVVPGLPVRSPAAVATDKSRHHVTAMNAHWFTDAAHTGAASIKPTFTVQELKAFEEILAFAINPANADMELLLCLDAAGTQEHDRSTGRKAAPLTDAMRAAMDAGLGVRQWHNHPSQDSLSHHDWLCAGVSEKVEVLALNHRGSIFVGRITDWDDRLEPLLAWLPRLGADLELHMADLARKNGLGIDLQVRLANFTGHVLNVALAAKMPVRYAYCLVGDDSEVFAACENLAICSEGVAFAEQAIQEWLDIQEA